MMHKLIFVTALISVVVVVAEPPITRFTTNSVSDSSSADSGLNGVVDKALLSKVAELLENGGDGSDDGQTTNEGEQHVDDELLGRIAQIINQNEGSVGPNVPKPLQYQGQPTDDSYGAAPPVDSHSGVQPPPVNHNFGNSQIELGRPEVARRIASFDIHDDNFQDSQGIQVPSTNSYSLPPFRGDSYAPPQTSNSNSRFEIGEPEAAERIASFDIQGSPQQSQRQASYYRPPQARRSAYF